MCGPGTVSAEDRDRIAAVSAQVRTATASPFGPDDQIGMLNLMTGDTMRHVLSELDGGKVFDLSVDYFIGMASWAAAGDPTYQIWMTHTPRGSVIDDLAGVGEEQNRLVSYSGDSVLMYTHCGTHVDTVNHFGYRGKVWNGFGGTAPICWPASNSAVHIYVRATSSVQCTPWLSPWLSLKFQPGPNEPVSPR